MRKYTETHEWVEVQGEIATVGITKQGVAEIGEIVYVELPQIGSLLQKGQEVAVIESTKAAIDIITPLSGEIIAVNSLLSTKIEKLNSGPEKEGWLFQMKLRDEKEVDSLLTKE